MFTYAPVSCPAGHHRPINAIPRTQFDGEGGHISDKNQGAGIVKAVVGIVYVIIMFLADFDSTVVVGALVIALIAVTSPWWRNLLPPDQSGLGR